MFHIKWLRRACESVCSPWQEACKDGTLRRMQCAGVVWPAGGEVGDGGLGGKVHTEG